MVVQGTIGATLESPALDYTHHGPKGSIPSTPVASQLLYLPVYLVKDLPDALL
jgi:hypothetical protein